MKEATKKKVIKALNTGLKVTGFAAGATGLALAMAGCPQPSGPVQQEQAQKRTEAITLNLNGSTISVNVTATLLRAEMDLVKSKLKTAFDKAAADDPSTAGRIIFLLNNFGFNIELVRTQEYSRYKHDGTVYKFFFNTDHVINAMPDNLATTVNDVVNGGFSGGVPQAKIVPTHDKGHAKCQAPKFSGVPLHLTTPYIAHI